MMQLLTGKRNLKINSVKIKLGKTQSLSIEHY